MAQSVFSLFTLRSLYLYHFAVLPLFPSCVHLKYLVLFPFCKREAVECSRCWLCPIHSPSAPKSPPGAHVLFASEALLSSLVTSGPALVFWPDRALGGEGGLLLFLLVLEAAENASISPNQSCHEGSSIPDARSVPDNRGPVRLPGSSENVTPGPQSCPAVLGVYVDLSLPLCPTVGSLFTLLKNLQPF